LKVSSITLYALPLLEVLLFTGSVFSFASAPVISAVLLLLAAFFLSLSLHVTYHEVAHHCGQWRKDAEVFMGVLLSLLMGISFHAYRLGHFNHHRYNNTLADFTSTWMKTGDGYVAKNLLIYCLTWPKVFLFASQQTRKTLEDGDASNGDIRLSAIEGGSILVFIAFLYSFDLVAVIMYVALVYLGWALVSLHNYGQHLPVEYGKFVATSYPATWYNRLLFKNGLHYEHHLYPGDPIAGLEADAQAPAIRWPHFIVPFVSSNQYFTR
jgi:fatty acid desaturase